MSYKWIVPAIVVSCGLVISSVIAQPPQPPQPPQTGPAPPIPAPLPAAPGANNALNPTVNDPFSGASPANEADTVVVRLRSAEVQAMIEILMSLLDKNELNAVHPTPDSRTNSLILRGAKKDMDRVLKLVQQIDSEPASDKPRIELPKSVLNPRRSNTPAAPNTTSWPMTATYGVNPRSPSAAESKLQREFSAFDGQSLELARKYRKESELLGSNHPEQQKLREQIEKLVGQAFDTRQAVQSEELKQLKERVAKVEQSLSKRVENRAAIVGKRTKELLEEDRDLEWSLSTGHLYIPGSVPRTVTRSDGSTVTVYEAVPNTSPVPVGVPATALPPAVPLPPSSAIVPQFQVGAVPTLVPAPQYAPPTGLNTSAAPGSQFSANSFAFPPGANLRGAYADAAATWKQFEKEIAEMKKTLKPEELETNANYQNAVQRRNSQRRILESLKREFEAQQTLLQLDLQSAKAELESAEVDYQRTLTLRKQNGASDAELQRSHSALQQAEIRVSRAKVLLDLHHAASAAETDTSNSDPAAKGAGSKQ